MLERFAADPAVLAAAAGLLVALLIATLVLLRRRARSPRDEAAEAAPGDATDRFRRGLGKSRSAFGDRLARALGRSGGADGSLEALEQALLESDVGVSATQDLLRHLASIPTAQRTPAAMRAQLRARLRAMLDSETSLEPGAPRPWVVLVVGVNGVGKTTTIGKLAARYRRAGLSVLLVAADTFRAAAAEQLSIWAERVGAQVTKQGQGADPSAVAFDGVQAAVARQLDVVLIDTAGRLHTKVNLMEELRKVHRVVGRALAGAPHEVLLVVDATTGQNAVSQARIFSEAVPVSGLLLTKLDGSARGGVTVALRREFDLPVRFVGLGESAEDLEPFDAAAFVDGILPSGEDDRTTP